jgi:hypothetical protein
VLSENDACALCFDVAGSLHYRAMLHVSRSQRCGCSEMGSSLDASCDKVRQYTAPIRLWSTVSAAETLAAALQPLPSSGTVRAHLHQYVTVQQYSV